MTHHWPRRLYVSFGRRQLFPHDMQADFSRFRRHPSIALVTHHERTRDLSLSHPYPSLLRSRVWLRPRFCKMERRHRPRYVHRRSSRDPAAELTLRSQATKQITYQQYTFPNSTTSVLLLLYFSHRSFSVRELFRGRSTISSGPQSERILVQRLMRRPGLTLSFTDDLFSPA